MITLGGSRGSIIAASGKGRRREHDASSPLRTLSLTWTTVSGFESRQHLCLPGQWRSLCGVTPPEGARLNPSTRPHRACDRCITIRAARRLRQHGASLLSREKPAPTSGRNEGRTHG